LRFLLAHDLQREVALALLQREFRLALQVAHRALQLLHLRLEHVLLGDGLNGAFAVAREGLLHLATRLIEQHLWVFQLLHLARHPCGEVSPESCQCFEHISCAPYRWRFKCTRFHK
jgi:hypothetical protein